jgi:DNA repair exonuclease SbcCD ATPase subunit
VKQISTFQISGMTLSGFKSYNGPTELSFGNPTIVTGGNGKGKSSVADAIAFIITGLPFFGERGIDRLHCDDNGDLFLRMGFVDGEGQAHELTRTRRSSRMTVTSDGYEIRQLDLTEMFGEKDVFLSIFNPLYFIEELGDNGKNLLERYLPAVSHGEIMEKLSEDTRESLMGQEFLSPEGYLKRLREDIRELEETVIYLTGQKDLTETQRRENQESLSDLTEKLAALTSEMELLEQKRYADLSISQMKEQLVELSSRYDEAAQDSGTAGQAEAAVAELHRRMGARGAEQYVSKFTDALADARAAVNELATRYAKEMGYYKGFHPGISCPVCHRPVTEENLGEVQGDLKKVITAIVAEGRERKAQLEELQALDAKSNAVFEQFKADDLQTLETQIQTLSSQNSAEAGGERNSELDRLRTDIQNLTATLEYGNLTQVEYDRLRECDGERRQFESDLAALQTLTGKSGTDYEAQIKAAQDQVIQKKKLISGMALYLSKRAELTFSALRMNRVAISLYDVVKTTGEIKDTFRFTYNGRRYDRLSLSEKVRAGMEVSEMMKRLTGRNYPVFVDNMESVEDLANVRPTGQVIMAKLVPGAGLSVKGRSQASAPSKAA